MISEIMSKLVQTAFAYSAVCVFFHLVESWLSRKTLAGPLRKLKMVVLCSLKLVLIFQLHIQDICQIQYNFKTLQEANKFIKNYEIKTFLKFPVFQEDPGFQNKSLCNSRLLEFFKHVIFPKVEAHSRKTIYNYRQNALRCFLLLQKNECTVKYL